MVNRLQFSLSLAPLYEVYLCFLFLGCLQVSVPRFAGSDKRASFLLLFIASRMLGVLWTLRLAPDSFAATACCSLGKPDLLQPGLCDCWGRVFCTKSSFRFPRRADHATASGDYWRAVCYHPMVCIDQTSCVLGKHASEKPWYSRILRFMVRVN